MNATHKHFTGLNRPVGFIYQRLTSFVSQFALALACSSICSAQVGELIAKHGLVIKGNVDGDLRLLTEGEVTFDPAAKVKGNVAVPEQTVAVNAPAIEHGRPSANVKFANPAGDAALKGQIVGLPPYDLPAVPLPPAAKGSQNQVISGSDLLPNDFSRIKDLTVRYRFEPVPIPPGTYGRLIVDGARVVLGVSGGKVPARYNLQSLEIRGNGTVDLAGPVIVMTGSVVGIDGMVGRADLPGWLDFRVASGAITLGSCGAIYGSVFAPASAVTVSAEAKVEGWLAADWVTVESNGKFKSVPPVWDPQDRHPSRAPAFSRKVTVLQSRLPNFVTMQSGRFFPKLTYSDDDVPTITLTEVPLRKADKAETEDQQSFFDAACLLLAFTGFDQGKIVLEPTGSRKKEGPLVVAMTKEDFIGHFWALDHRLVEALTIQEIRQDPKLLSRFMQRSLALAAAKQAS